MFKTSHLNSRGVQGFVGNYPFGLSKRTYWSSLCSVAAKQGPTLGLLAVVVDRSLDLWWISSRQEPKNQSARALNVRLPL
jgi:hypothetical protein